MYQARSKQDSYEQEASKTTTSKKQARSVPISHVHHGAGAGPGAHDAEESPHDSASDGPTWHHRSLHITGQIARCEVDAEVGGVEDLEEQGRAGGGGGL